MGFDDAMIDFILESDQIVLGRGVAVELVECHRVEEAGPLVAQMRTELGTRQCRRGVEVSPRPLFRVKLEELTDVGGFAGLDFGWDDASRRGTRIVAKPLDQRGFTRGIIHEPGRIEPMDLGEIEGFNLGFDLWSK